MRFAEYSIISSVLLLLFLSSALPVLAQTQARHGQGQSLDKAKMAQAASQTSATDANAKLDNKKSRSFVERLLFAPVILASTITGTATGFPVAMVRLGLHDAADTASALPIIGSTDNPALLWSERAAVYPICAITGVIQAPFYSWHNAWRNSAEAPFSKDALGIGKLDDDWE